MRFNLEPNGPAIGRALLTTLALGLAPCILSSLAIAACSTVGHSFGRPAEFAAFVVTTCGAWIQIKGLHRFLRKAGISDNWRRVRWLTLPLAYSALLASMPFALRLVDLGSRAAEFAALLTMVISFGAAMYPPPGRAPASRRSPTRQRTGRTAISAPS